MGCTLGNFVDGDDDGDIILSDELRLSVFEIRRLKKYLSTNYPASSDIYTLTDFEYIDRSVLFRKILGNYDIDMSGKLSFCQFVCSIWCFLSLPSAALDSFLFDLYDEGGTGALNIAELKHMMRDVHSKNYDSSCIQSFVQNLEIEGKKSQAFITREYFLQMIQGSPELLFPVLNLQSRARNIVVGEDFWNILETRRSEEERVNTSSDRMYRIRTHLRMRDFHNKLCQQLSAHDGTNVSIIKGNIRCGDKLMTVSPVSPDGPRLRSRSNSDGNLANTYQLAECEKGGVLKMKPKPLSRANSSARSSPFSRTNSMADESRSFVSDVITVVSGAAGALLSKQNSKVFSISDVCLDDEDGQEQCTLSEQARQSRPVVDSGFDFLEAVRRKLEQELNASPPAVLRQLNLSDSPSSVCSGNGESDQEDYDDNMSDISEESGKYDDHEKWSVRIKPGAIVRRHNSFSAPVVHS